MPWTVEDVDDFIEGLTQREKRKWKKLANEVYNTCRENGGSDQKCSEKAIRTANKNYKDIDLQAEANSMDTDVLEKYKDREVVEKDHLFKLETKIDRGAIRPDTLQGRKHLVAPVVALKEAVVKGRFIPGEVIQNSSMLWNNRPIPIGHPPEASANQKEVLDKEVIGKFLNVESTPKKLKGEVWIDKELALSDDFPHSEQRKDTYKRLAQGESMDVSTSFWADVLDDRGQYDGDSYEGVQFNIRPDHLAILPEERGALSRDEGVGVPIKNSQGGGRIFTGIKFENVRETARTPEYSEVADPDADWSRPTLSEFAEQRGWENIDTVNDLSDSQRKEAANASLLGMVDGETWNELTFFIVVDGNGVLYKSALTTVRGGRGQQADIPQSAYESASQKAKQLLQDVFDVEYPDEENKEGIRRAGLLELGKRVINQLSLNQRGENMDKEKLVNKLLNSDSINLSEGTLLDTDESVLEEMVDNIEDENSGGEDSDSEGDTQDLSEGGKDTVFGMNKKEFGEFVQNQAGEAVEEKVGEMVTTDKEKLVNKLSSLNEVPYEKSELEEMPESALKKMNNSLTKGSYAGQVGQLGKNQTEEMELVDTRPIILKDEEGE